MVYDDDDDTPSGLTAAFMCEEGNPRRINEDKCKKCGDQDVGECGNCDEHCICEEDEDHEDDFWNRLKGDNEE